MTGRLTPQRIERNAQIAARWDATFQRVVAEATAAGDELMAEADPSHGHISAVIAVAERCQTAMSALRQWKDEVDARRALRALRGISIFRPVPTRSISPLDPTPIDDADVEARVARGELVPLERVDVKPDPAAVAALRARMVN